jgi:hypothetical protein
MPVMTQQILARLRGQAKLTEMHDSMTTDGEAEMLDRQSFCAHKVECGSDLL